MLDTVPLAPSKFYSPARQPLSLIAVLGIAGSVITIASAPAQAQTIYALGQSSTAAFSQGTGTGDTARGWEFQVNASNLQVFQLGVNAAISNTPITLSLWDDATQTLLEQTSAVSSASNWVFANLAVPVSLTSGHQYSVIGWANTASSWYLFDNTPPSFFEPTGAIQYENSSVSNGGGPNTFPTQNIGGQYGVTDIGYRIGSAAAAPEPSSIALLALSGLPAVGMIVRRCCKVA